jgi:hypothetical protein
MERLMRWAASGHQAGVSPETSIAEQGRNYE